MRSDDKFRQHRAVVTDTTPYEVPVIFTNDKFYKLISSKYSNADIQKNIDKLLARQQVGKKQSDHFIPYNYVIKKDSVRTTTLSIPHPLWQKEISLFFSAYEETILALCSKSRFSLRKPTAVAALYTGNNLDEHKALKSGSTHSSEEDSGETAASKIISYFKYGKYTLLAKFYESSEFINLERRYKYIRHLDVSKCFYHIYTHSVTWASKGKEFAKNNTASYSFENKFDKLMQQSNYNETNGIIVGPEVSRIFAELIMQSIDANCEKILATKYNLILKKNYEVYRYVDDFNVFTNSEYELDIIEKVIRDELEKYKLYINEKKVETSHRPFITPLSIARKELRSVINNIHEIIDVMADPTTKTQTLRTKHRILRGTTSDIRAVVKRNSINFSSISGWILSSIRKIASHAATILENPASEEKSEIWLDIIKPLIDISFHVCALDLRVRTTYSLCQLIIVIKKAENQVSKSIFDNIELITQDLITELIYNATHEDPDRINDVDIQNLLITGAFFFRSSFIENEKINGALHDLIKSQYPNYFNMITLKFCLMQTKELNTNLNDKLHSHIFDFLKSTSLDLQKSDHYMILCDYLGFPGVDQKHQRDVFKTIFGGEISTVTLTGLASVVGFVEWNNLNIEHLLERKQLRPVYEIA